MPVRQLLAAPNAKGRAKRAALAGAALIQPLAAGILLTLVIAVAGISLLTT